MFFFLEHKNKKDKELLRFFKNILGLRPKNIFIYKVALIHKSRSHKDSKGHKINNERLEYLGDTVLSTIVGDFLFKKYPLQGEGFLTEMRSKLVSRVSLNKLAQRIGLSKFIEYSKDSSSQFISMDGDAFEAIVGALYIDKGYNYTYKVLVNRILNVYLDIDSMENTEWNYKSKIIDWGQKTKRKVSFQVIETIETYFRKQYKVQVFVDDQAQEIGIDFSIKSAEQLAAEKTYKKLQEEGVILAEILNK